MAELHLCFRDDRNGDLQWRAEEGVLTNIYASKGKSIRGVTIPVGYSSYRKFDLDPGAYLVECVLPSGDVVTEDVVLKEGDVKKVCLEQFNSPHEWLSWQSYSGSLTPARKQQAKPRLKDVPKSVGDLLQSKGRERQVLDSIRLIQAFDGSANSIYRNMLASADKNDAENGLAQELNRFSEIVLSRVFDITSRGEFNRESLWQTISQFVGPEGEFRSQDLMRQCQEAMAGTSADIMKLSPARRDEDASVFHIPPQGEPPILTCFIWSPSGAELMRLPHQWMNVRDHSASTVEVLIDTKNSGREFRSSVTVHDPTMLSAFSYFSSGSLPTAGVHVRRAQEMLYGKVINPYAAALGAYILMSLDDPDSSDSWPGWIENLFEWNPWLPDAAVLKGWLELKQKNPSGAIESFKQAVHRGVPVYSMGVKRLLDGLRLFKLEDEEAAQLAQLVQRVAWRTNMNQPFTIVRLGPT